MLRNARSGPLAEQQGFTVDDLRNAYGRGEEQARQVAEKNGVKANAYGIAYDSTLSLQHGLTALANEGNQRIREVQDSSQPAAGKVTQIVTVVNQYQALSNIAAAKYSGNVLDAMQTILDCDGTGLSARQDAQSNGLNVGEMFRGRPQSRDLEQQVGGMLEREELHQGPALYIETRKRLLVGKNPTRQTLSLHQPDGAYPIGTATSGIFCMSPAVTA